MNQNIEKREHKAIFQTYKRLPIAVEKAEGCIIRDIEGNEYIDMLGGIAVNALGHGHPRILEAINEQAKRYTHISNYFYQEAQVKLAEKIKEMSGYDRVFFSNSGAEAIEGAIKLVRRWGSEYGKTNIVSFTGGFHGRTYGALSMMDKPHYKADMGPFLPNMLIIEYNNSAALRETVNESTVAVILEFLQGEGGVSAADDTFIKTIFELKEKFGFLVIADEIQAGVGRTGDFFGFHKYGVRPDVVTMAKGIGGGLPLGAILGVESLAGVWEPGMHGTTYGGNALACAAGLVVLEELEAQVYDNVRSTGDYLKKQLKILKKEFHELILETRGRGLMQGLLLSFDAGILVKALLDRKVITNSASGNVLRLVPPLIISEKEIDSFIEALRDCLIAISD